MHANIAMQFQSARAHINVCVCVFICEMWTKDSEFDLQKECEACEMNVLLPAAKIKMPIFD